MAHEIMANDKVMLGSNVPAWHGLGTIVEGTPNSAEAIKLAGLDWKVNLEAARLNDGKGGTIEIPNAFATVRDDLEQHDQSRVLGMVTGRYTPIQNAEGFAVLDDIAGEGGARFETAGSLRNGRTVWMMAVTPEAAKVKDDTLHGYLLCSMGHDGSRAMQVQFTPVRVVCANTLAMAVGGNVQRTVTIPHNSNKDRRLADARNIMGLSKAYFEKHANIMRSLSRKRIDDRFAYAFTMALMPDTGTEGKFSLNEKKRARVFQLYKGGQKGGDQQAVNGTAYGLLNAFAEFVDHERRTVALNGRAKADARFESVMLGSGARMKEVAGGLLTRVLEIEKSVEVNPELDALCAQLDLDGERKSEIDKLLAGLDLN